jgi:hypothetical protein
MADAGFRIYGSGCSVQDAGFRIHGSGSYTLYPESAPSDSGLGGLRPIYGLGAHLRCLARLEQLRLTTLRMVQGRRVSGKDTGFRKYGSRYRVQDTRFTVNIYIYIYIYI